MSKYHAFCIGCLSAGGAAGAYVADNPQHCAGACLVIVGLVIYWVEKL